MDGEFNIGCKGFYGKESRGTGTRTGKLLGTRSRLSLPPRVSDSLSESA